MSIGDDVGMSLAGSVAALQGALDAVMTTKDLCEAVTGAKSLETIQAINDAHAGAAARLLREARDRQGEARRDKFLLAISHLELVYETSLKRVAVARRWFVPVNDQALLDGCQACLWLAASYCALGNDPVSVQERLADAKAFYALWGKRERKRISEEPIGWWANPQPMSTVRMLRDAKERRDRPRYHTLDRSRDSLHELAERIVSVGVNPRDLDSHLQPIPNNVTARVLTGHHRGRHRRNQSQRMTG